MAIPGLPGGFFSSTRETHLFSLEGHLWCQGVGGSGRSFEHVSRSKSRRLSVRDFVPVGRWSQHGELHVWMVGQFQTDPFANFETHTHTDTPSRCRKVTIRIQSDFG